MKKYVYVIAALCCMALMSCDAQSDVTPTTDNDVPDYADPSCWYRGEEITTQQATDIFYVVPTCIWDYSDSTGVKHHLMDIHNVQQRELVNPSIELARHVLSDSCNFFSPYYRQISMDSWLTLDTALIRERFETAFADVRAAFNYYIEHYNNGRPFILAGHSQGAKAVIELLKREMDDNLYSRLVATYAIGYTITQAEVDAHRYLRPAQGADDVGVIIHFNSVTRSDAVTPIFADNVVCINPINWATDETPAVSYQGFTAAIDTTLHAIVVNGVNDDDYFIPSVATLLPRGNLHVYEFYLYEEDLRANVLRRIAAYNKRK